MARMKLQPRVGLPGSEAVASKPKAVGYVRVSTQEQVDHGVSLEAQKDLIRRYCELKGFELVRIFEDAGVSGGTPIQDRPSGREMVGYRPSTRKPKRANKKRQEQAAMAGFIEEHGIRNVVTKSLDRLFRDALDAHVVLGEMDHQGVAIHMTDLNIDTGSESGKLFFAILATVAQMERAKIRERVKSGLAYKKATGKAWGHTPVGYARSDTQVGTDQRGEPVIDRSLSEDGTNAPVVREIVEMRYLQGMSFRDIANNLTERGVPTSQTRKKGTPRWWPMTVKVILETNPISLQWTRHLQELDAQEAALAA